MVSSSLSSLVEDLKGIRESCTDSQDGKKSCTIPKTKYITFLNLCIDPSFSKIYLLLKRHGGVQKEHTHLHVCGDRVKLHLSKQ